MLRHLFIYCFALHALLVSCYNHESKHLAPNIEIESKELKDAIIEYDSILHHNPDSFVGASNCNYPSNPQPIGFSGILLAKRQNSFYCTYFLHNRNVADTKSPYPIKRLEVIRWFNQKSMVFNQSLS